VLAERARGHHARPLLDSVQTPDWLKPTLQLLAGRAFITRDLDTARALAAQLPDGAVCVTRDGEVVYASGLLALPPGPRSPIILGQEASHEKLLIIDPVAAKANRERAAQARERAQRELDAARRRLDEHNRLRDAFGREASGRRNRRDDAARRITSLEEQLAQLAGDIEQVTQDAGHVEEQIVMMGGSVAQTESAHTQAVQHLAQIERDLREHMAGGWMESLNAVHAAVASNSEAVRSAQNMRRDRLAALADGRAQREVRAQRLAELEVQHTASQQLLAEVEQAAAQAAARLRELDAFMNPIQAELSVVEQQLSDTETRRREAERVLREAESRLSAATLELARHNDELQALYERAADALEFDEGRRTDDGEELRAQIVNLLESLPVVSELPLGLDERMTQLRNQIKRLGAINFEAQAEYDELKQRHAFLTEQTDDLERAYTSLQQVIVELNDVMRATFKQTFEAIATAFQSTFKILFGGGQAKLTLLNAENLDEAAVEIHAQPPGKRPQALALLSGGERSLTAAALLFAILRVKPTPFCVLDEVDAALDEANVGRFRNMLENLSEQTQFIVITHNRRTVEAASTIYGISMGADGASTSLSLRLDEIEMKQ
jgi:chromosome segregation protein